MGLGFWADGKLGTGPILMVVGAFVGGGAGFYSLYFHIVIEPRQREDDPMSFLQVRVSVHDPRIDDFGRTLAVSR